MSGAEATDRKVLLGHHLKKLKLPTILAEYDKYLCHCTRIVFGPYRSGRSGQGAPERKAQKMPFSTRGSSARGTPRGLFGSSGSMTDHSKSVRS